MTHSSTCPVTLGQGRDCRCQSPRTANVQMDGYDLAPTGGAEAAPIAGRELDAMIARRVFGHVVARKGSFLWCVDLLPPDEEWPSVDIVAYAHSVQAVVPDYSTDIAAAWTILKHIRENWIFSKRERFFAALKQEARLTDGTSITWPAALIAWPDSFPEKLCRAALAAAADTR